MGNLFSSGTRKNIEGCDKRSGTSLNLSGIKGRVDYIHVEGLRRTDESMLEPILSELFQARDFQDICQKSHHVRDKLQKLSCFKDIKITIDASQGPGASKNGYEVTFQVEEQKRVVGGVNTLVGHNEASLALSLKLPNLIGRGELLNAEYSYGSNRTSNFTVSASRPFFFKIPLILTASIFQQGAVWPSSGYRKNEKGGLIDVCFNSTPVIKHNLQWEASLREIGSLSSETAFQVREVTGPDLKSAIRHILSYDNRDIPVFSTCGNVVRLTTELAGLGGDVGFIKNEIKLETFYSLYENIVFQGSFCMGHLKSIQEKNVGISDQFYLGGPLMLRGFELRGVGPKSGSEMYWACGLRLLFPAPFLKSDGGGFIDHFRGHIFLNTGNICDASSFIDSISENARLSYGLGIILRLGQSAKLEVNYCFPKQFQEGDKIVEGLQFGIGVDF